jgi:2-iminobutanoate/2-iminopropanoate deaminase
MQREIIRVEPIDCNFEKWGAPVSTCTRAGNMVFVSGMPPCGSARSSEKVT